MPESQLVCSSCKRRITNAQGNAKFPCPSCAKTTIIRCAHCRELSTKYKCLECGFVGPN